MYEKIQRLNKRAKQFNLTIIQVPTLFHRDELNTFNSNFVISKGNKNLVNHLFANEYLWMFMGFNLIDKFANNRLYIHSTGLLFIKVDKNDDHSVSLKENSAIFANADSCTKENTFKKTHATFHALEIVLEIVEKFEMAMKAHDEDFDNSPVKVKHKPNEYSSETKVHNLPNYTKSKLKKQFNRLKSGDDIQIKSASLLGKTRLMKQREYKDK